MLYFLVSGEIRKQNYMGSIESIKDTRLVYANNATEAEQKYEHFWDTKSSQYEVYYTVVRVTVAETIV